MFYLRTKQKTTPLVLLMDNGTCPRSHGRHLWESPSIRLDVWMQRDMAISGPVT